MTLAFHRRQRRISQLCPCLVLPKALIKLHCRIGGGGDWRGRPEIGYDYKHHHQPFSANQDTQRFATPTLDFRANCRFLVSLKTRQDCFPTWRNCDWLLTSISSQPVSNPKSLSHKDLHRRAGIQLSPENVNHHSKTGISADPFTRASSHGVIGHIHYLCHITAAEKCWIKLCFGGPSTLASAFSF